MFIAENERNPDLYLHYSNRGLIIGGIGILLLIIVFLVDAVRTYKKWKITEKQKTLAQRQKNTRVNKIIFWMLALYIISRVTMGGTGEVFKLAKYADFIVLIAVIYSIYLWIKTKK